jgi:hypothetical protein
MEVNPMIKKMTGVHGKKSGVFIIGIPDCTFCRIDPRSKKSTKGLE